MPDEDRQAPVRTFWSGTITFGLVSIPVDLFAAVQSRATAMKMVDAKGGLLGRQYYCPEDGKRLANDDIVRGYETKSGKLVVVTDEELQAIEPEKTRDIDLQKFVPLEQIQPTFYERPYFLLPSGRSTKAYHLLAETMQRARRVGIATFVMRDQESLVAIISEGGVLRAETLRFASELKAPEDVGLPAAEKPAPALVKRFSAAISCLKRDGLDANELADQYANAIRALVEKKQKHGRDVIETPSGAAEDDEEGGADIVDLMKILRERLAKGTTVSKALASERPSKRRQTSDRAAELSKEALYEKARKLGIPGRSRMGKKELQEAIDKAA